MEPTTASSRRPVLATGAVVGAACAACCAPPVVAALGVTFGLAALAGIVAGVAAAVAVAILGLAAVARRRAAGRNAAGPTTSIPLHARAAPPARTPLR